MQGLKLIILMMCMSNCYSKIYKKCCPVDKILLNTNLKNNTLKYECSDINLYTYNETETIIPLKFKNNAFGIPENCSLNLKCIDKTTEDTIIRLYCDSKVANEHIRLPTLYKCCPNNMYYNTTSKSCNYNEFAQDTLIRDDNSPIFILKYGNPSCSDGLLVDYLIDSKDVNRIYNGIFEFKDTFNESYELPQNLSANSYCIDRLQNNTKIRLRYCIDDYVEYCKSKISCIRKCCAMGQMYILSQTKGITCGHMWNQTFELTYSNITTLKPPEKLAILPRPTCRYNKYFSSTSSIFPNGSILLDDGKIFPPYIHKFCVENFHENTGKRPGQNYVICFPPQQAESQAGNFYYFTGLTISIMFLAVTLIVYFFLPDLQNLHGKTVMCHTASFLAAYICLAVVKRNITRFSPYVCSSIGYCILYTFTATFCWLNVMCFDIWWTFGVVKARGLAKNGNKKRFFYYCLYAFGVPFLITTITAIAHIAPGVPDNLRPNIGNQGCWFDTYTINLQTQIVYTIYFAGPVGLLIFCNVIFFILTVKNCLKIRSDIHKMQEADLNKKTRFLADKATLKMNLKLFVIMGITWVFELISTYQKEPVILWAILDVFNVLQGFWIFCIFVLKEQVWKALKNKMGWQIKKEGSSQTQTTSVSGKTSIASNNSLRMNEELKKSENMHLQIARTQRSKVNAERKVSNLSNY